MESVTSAWLDLMDNQSDPRTSHFYLMSSPFPTIMICLCYVYIVKYAGPKFMENRNPFKITGILITYNLLQAMLSFYLFIEAAKIAWFNGYNWRCQAIDHSDCDFAIRMVNGSYVYYLSKFTEFFDTLFFVLRKRNHQVSTLHLIHHGLMPFSVWWGVKFMPGGHATFFAFLNTFVHIVMYTYYMMAAVGPEMQKYLWWKKYLTILQMIQFICVFVHSIQLIFHNPCNFSMAFVYFIMGHSVLFLVLFANFYSKTYTEVKEMKRMKTK